MGAKLHHYQGHAEAHSGDVIVTKSKRVTFTQASRTFYDTQGRLRGRSLEPSRSQLYRANPVWSSYVFVPKGTLVTSAAYASVSPLEAAPRKRRISACALQYNKGLCFWTA